jgi:ribonuclease R
MTDLPTRILEALARPSYTPVKPKVLAKRMDITSDEEYASFRIALKALIREGRVAVGGNSTLRAVDAHGTVGGIFRQTSASATATLSMLPVVTRSWSG